MADKKITDLTVYTAPAGEDLVEAVDDPSGTPASRKITLANLFKVVNALTALTAGSPAPTVDKADVLYVYDASDAAAEKATVAELFAAIASLTSLSASPALNDQLVVTDTDAASAAKEITVQELFNAMNRLTSLFSGSPLEPVFGGDELHVWNASASQLQKITAANFFTVIANMTSLSAAPAVGDQMIIYDISAPTDPAKELTVQELFNAINNLTALTAGSPAGTIVTASDKIPIFDASDAALETVTVAELHDARTRTWPIKFVADDTAPVTGEIGRVAIPADLAGRSIAGFNVHNFTANTDAGGLTYTLKMDNGSPLTTLTTTAAVIQQNEKDSIDGTAGVGNATTLLEGKELVLIQAGTVASGLGVEIRITWDAN